MDDLRSDPEYEVRWPLDLVATELDRLIDRGSSDGCGVEWRDEVEALLRQVFASVVPLREFGEQWNRSGRRAGLYGDEDPF